MGLYSRIRLCACLFFLFILLLFLPATFPKAAAWAEPLPFEYGRNAIFSLSGAEVVNPNTMYEFTFDGKQAYYITNTEKGNRYLLYKNAASMIDENGKNRMVDVRIYFWKYHETGSGSKAVPFFYLSEDGIVHFTSNNQKGDYAGNKFIGTLQGENNITNSNCGVETEYHFYDSKTGEEIPFQSAITYNDLDGASAAAGYVNEGIAITGGEYETVLPEQTTITESVRDGYTWYQGTAMTETLGSMGLTQEAQKIMVKFKSTPENPYSVIHRINTKQAGDNGVVSSYEQTMMGSASTISYYIAKSDLPSLSSDKTMTQLIQGGGGEQQRHLNYQTNISGEDALALLNVPAEAVTGYTFDGWYTDASFAEDTKWNGSSCISRNIILYGRYVKNNYKLTVRFLEVKEDGTLTSNKVAKTQSASFQFGGRVATKGISIAHTGHDVLDAAGNPGGEFHEADDYRWELSMMTVNGGVPEKAEAGQATVHLKEGELHDGDMEVCYYYFDKSVSMPVFSKTADDSSGIPMAEEGKVFKDAKTIILPAGNASVQYAAGESVPFTLRAVLPESAASFPAYSLVFHDVLPSGLSYAEGSLAVYADGTKIPADAYEAEITETGITVTVSDVLAAPWNGTAGTEISVRYTAVLGDDVQMQNVNEAFLEYTAGNGMKQTESSSARIYTFSLTFEKTDAEGQKLDGAAFSLYKKNADGVYSLVSESRGNDAQFLFNGLSAGRYRLSETTVPDGYNKAEDLFFNILAEESLQEDGTPAVFVTMADTEGNPIKGWIVSEDGTAFSSKIKNTEGLVLPATGGNGIFPFYIIGGALIILSGIILMDKKHSFTQKS